MLNSPDELFCQHCGAPQLRYEPLEDTGTSFVSAQQTVSARGFEAISWKAAIASAILVAVPVAPASTCAWLRREVDELVCLHAPEDFYAVGQFYLDFSQVSDEEVAALLRRAEEGETGQRL